jgi:hypothetical protein
MPEDETDLWFGSGDASKALMGGDTRYIHLVRTEKIKYIREFVF